MIMKRNKIYTEPNGGFRIPHNKHLGNKHEERIVPKTTKQSNYGKHYQMADRRAERNGLVFGD